MQWCAKVQSPILHWNGPQNFKIYATFYFMEHLIVQRTFQWMARAFWRKAIGSMQMGGLGDSYDPLENKGPHCIHTFSFPQQKNTRKIHQILKNKKIGFWNHWSLCDGEAPAADFFLQNQGDAIPVAFTVLAFAGKIKESYSPSPRLFWKNVNQKIIRSWGKCFLAPILRHSSLSLICLSLTALLSQWLGEGAC